MTRKAYYNVLIFALGFLFCLEMIPDKSMLSYFGHFSFLTAEILPGIQLGLPLFIVLFESYNSRQLVKKTNSILIPVFVIGLTIGFMGYSFGKYIFLVTCLIAIAFLFTETFKRREGRLILLPLLIFVVSEYLLIFLVVFHLPRALAGLFQMAIIPILFFLILFLLLKRKKTVEKIS